MNLLQYFIYIQIIIKFLPSAKSESELSEIALKLFRNLRNTNLAGRIVGGVNAKPNEFPFHVFLKSSSGICGGVIYSKFTIITAAHCFGDNDESKSKYTYTVVAGAHIISFAKSNKDKKNWQERKQKEFIVHPKYNSDTQENDIALIKVDKPFNFNKIVKKVQMPPPAFRTAEGSRCTATGWGKVDPREGKDTLPDILQKVGLKISNLDKCIAAYNYVDNSTSKTTISELQICAGSDVGRRDSCVGDSGGPLICHDLKPSYLCGIVSYGGQLRKYTETLLCGHSRELPGVYTRVSRYIEWIKKNGGFNYFSNFNLILFCLFLELLVIFFRFFKN